MYTAAMNNPAKLSAYRVVGAAAIVAYAAAAIVCAIASYTVMVLLPWLWRAIVIATGALWALRVPLALFATLVVVVVVAAMLPQVAVGVLAAVVFAVVTKP